VLSIATAIAAQPPGDLHRRAGRAAERARGFLLARVGPDGRCLDEYPPDHPHHLYGGRTALTAYALLTDGLSRNHETLDRCLRWLVEAELDGVYPVATRAMALAAVRGRAFQARLEADVTWLVRAAADDGTYTYTPCDGATCERYDNATAHAAVLAVAAGEARGAPVPDGYWRVMERHWTTQQQGDGGFGYRIPPRRLRTETYGSMTAAGLAAVGACFDRLHRDRFIRCRPVEPPRLLTGPADWIARRFSAEVNPGKGVEWYYYWLYAVAQAARRTGQKRFGEHDWYADGAAALLDRQLGDGSFGFGERVEETALALIFLAGGRAPVAVNKLRYDGRWNPRPHDAANLARWLSYTFERPVNWQIVSADGPAADLGEAPILYVSGAGAAGFDARQERKLRRYVLGGGLIVSEAACNNGEFTLSARRLLRRLFPDYPPRRLPDDHPAYSQQYALDARRPLEGVSNGVRLLAVHSPTELSLGLQRGPAGDDRADFEQLANLFMLATGGGRLPPRGEPAERPVEPYEPVATIRVARLRHDANCDPEPLAWPRLTAAMARRHRIRLVVSEPMEMARLDADDWPVAAMTGTAELVLSDVQRAALHRYVTGGGTLVVDAAGGSRAFAESVRRQVLPLAGGGRPARWTPVGGPADLSDIRYRPAYARTLGDARDVPRLLAVTREGRLAVVFSPEDITAGLVGYPYAGIRGYAPETAAALMTNILCHVAGVSSP
jgi:hypothetical protein